MARRKLNLGKISRHIARSTPDSMWRTFSYEDEQDYIYGYDDWVQSFVKNMKIKHGDKFKTVIIHQSVMSELPGAVRVQLVVELYG